MVKNYLKLLFALVFATNVMAQNIPSYVPKDGLVGYWPFNGNANDESGNGSHGTISGATLTLDRNGKTNSAYSFDGIKNFISITPSKNLSLGNQFTISIWFKRNLSSDNDRIFSFEKAGSPDGYQFRFAIDVNTIDNNKLYFIGASNNVNNSTGWTNNTGYTLKTKNTIDNSIWNNVILTRNNSLFMLFLNGSLQNSSQTSQIIDFNGKLDDIAIYNRALSDQEVKQLYEGCTKETATSSSFNSVVYTTNTPVNLSANPTGGTFNGEAVSNNSFNPSKAKLGKNQVKYNFKNSTGCADSTNFTMILVDTLGNKCSTYDTILKINFKLTTGIKAGQLTSMNVYPNPTSDVLIIEANDIQALGGYKYKIVDLQGKEVYNALATSTRTEISLKTIGSKGMYILHIVDEKGVSIENKKIVLE
jgi:hypothetical protein